MRCLTMVLGLVMSLGAHAASVYRWVDANGVVQYSDRPPQANARIKPKQDSPVQRQRVIPTNTQPASYKSRQHLIGALQARGVQIGYITIPGPQAPKNSNLTAKAPKKR